VVFLSGFDPKSQCFSGVYAIVGALFDDGMPLSWQLDQEISWRPRANREVDAGSPHGVLMRRLPVGLHCARPGRADASV
tara:strand:- start:6394 stop:6630 length:237 start_codon:yes stop_codon:yes gene_type:complete